MAKPNSILEMDPEHYREIDGVVFDLDSYNKHCNPPQAQPAAPNEKTKVAVPAPVFAVPPHHEGWYPATDEQPPAPIMGGALPPVEIVIDDQGCTHAMQTIWLPGSGSGSYLTSYLTSYRTSYLSSGSGSYVFGSGVYLAGGYGLELI